MSPQTKTTRRARVGGLGAALALLLSVAVGTAAPTPAHAYDEGTIVALANQARADNGLGGLVHNGSLDAVAASWAQQMAANGTLSHNPSVGQQIPGGWSRWGENVAQGYRDGAAAHSGWMNSPGHRANILGPFTDVGVSLIEANGSTWAVQVFAAYPGSGTPAAPAPAPAPAPATGGGSVDTAAVPADAAAQADAERIAADQRAAEQMAADAQVAAEQAAAAAAEQRAAVERATATRQSALSSIIDASPDADAPIGASEADAGAVDRIDLTEPVIWAPWAVVLGIAALAAIAMISAPGLRRR